MQERLDKSSVVTGGFLVCFLLFRDFHIGKVINVEDEMECYKTMGREGNIDNCSLREKSQIHELIQQP